MGRKHAYATKADLERLALRMQKTGILFSEGVREFKKQFILAALRTARGNKSRAAQVLGVHVNTLDRNIRALGIDIRVLHSGDYPQSKKSTPRAQRKRSIR